MRHIARLLFIVFTVYRFGLDELALNRGELPNFQINFLPHRISSNDSAAVSLNERYLRFPKSKIDQFVINKTDPYSCEQAIHAGLN